MAFGRKNLKKRGLDKDFNQIIEPLSGMIDDLESYAEAQQTNQGELEEERNVINEQINLSVNEQRMSKAMGSKLRDLTDPEKQLVFITAKKAADEEEEK